MKWLYFTNSLSLLQYRSSLSLLVCIMLRISFSIAFIKYATSMSREVISYEGKCRITSNNTVRWKMNDRCLDWGFKHYGLWVSLAKLNLSVKYNWVQLIHPLPPSFQFQLWLFALIVNLDNLVPFTTEQLSYRWISSGILLINSNIKKYFNWTNHWYEFFYRTNYLCETRQKKY